MGPTPLTALPHIGIQFLAQLGLVARVKNEILTCLYSEIYYSSQQHLFSGLMYKQYFLNCAVDTDKLQKCPSYKWQFVKTNLNENDMDTF